MVAPSLARESGVGADVALEMDPAQAGDVSEQAAIEADHIGEMLRIVDETLHLVVGRGGVGRRPLVPHVAIQLAIVLDHEV